MIKVFVLPAIHFMVQCTLALIERKRSELQVEITLTFSTDLRVQSAVRWQARGVGYAHLCLPNWLWFVTSVCCSLCVERIVSCSLCVKSFVGAVRIKDKNGTNLPARFFFCDAAPRISFLPARVVWSAQLPTPIFPTSIIFPCTLFFIGTAYSLQVLRFYLCGKRSVCCSMCIKRIVCCYMCV